MDMTTREEHHAMQNTQRKEGRTLQDGPKEGRRNEEAISVMIEDCKLCEKCSEYCEIKRTQNQRRNLESFLRWLVKIAKGQEISS